MTERTMKRWAKRLAENAKDRMGCGACFRLGNEQSQEPKAVCFAFAGKMKENEK